MVVTYDTLYQLKTLDRGTLTGTPPNGITVTPYGKDCDSFADCICIELVDGKACQKRAVKACKIANSR